MTREAEQETAGARLKRYRDYRGYSQEEVAKVLGVPRSAISLMERGERGIDVTELKRLAQLYQCSVAELAGEVDPSAVRDSSIDVVARAASELTPDDRREVLQFAQFLKARRNREQKDGPAQ